MVFGDRGLISATLLCQLQAPQQSHKSKILTDNHKGGNKSFDCDGLFSYIIGLGEDVIRED